VVHFRPPDPGPFRGARFPVWCADIARSGWYGFPVDARGTLKLGRHGPGARFRQGDALQVTAADRDAFAAFVRSTFPAAADAPIVSTRLCLYCDTWDGDFLIDRDPRRPGLVVAAGGSGHAFKFAPLLGGIIADVVEQKSRLDRFAWRRPGDRVWEQARSHGDG
jgi:glycine/D-amino acid oxidase-like deaminating enzyme